MNYSRQITNAAGEEFHLNADGFYSPFQDYTKDEAIQLALNVFSVALSTNLKPTEYEVGVVTVDDPTFKILTPDEIEHQLNLINERD